MKKNLTSEFLVCIVFCSYSLFAQNKSRKELLKEIVSQNLSSVETQEITIASGIKAPKHIHTCPVVGYVISGSVIFQVEGQEQKLLQKGDAFYEPKNKTILHFDNASKETELTFVVFYLKEGSEKKIRMLEE
ncbi:Cupin domain-containing protein [Maribacter dokdonensis]|uniref:Cupin domain-containing protein n=1 Tax=Maribacter dokdonensis TaxID=320912 RepID=A0ABY0UMM7_9FLAO|nr:cupin domain-containing protein [Maribacter dokdonensis]SDS92144.1 Cupin domain-containing protein [Maribacter dokdonensis]